MTIIRIIILVTTYITTIMKKINSSENDGNIIHKNKIIGVTVIRMLVK